MDFMSYFLLALGLTGGGFAGWWIKVLFNIPVIKKLNEKIEEAKKNEESAKKEAESIKSQLIEKMAELKNSNAMLGDALAAMKVIKGYEKIDAETRKTIEEVKLTVSEDGKVTEDTFSKYQEMIKKMNDKNKTLNGNK